MTERRALPGPPTLPRRHEPATGSPRLAIALGLAALLACGGGNPGSTAEESDDSARPPVAAPRSAPADSLEAGPPSDQPTGQATGQAGETDLTRETDPGAEEEADRLPPWTTQPQSVESDGELASQVGLRTGRHDDFDRIVLVFSDRVPGYRVHYSDGPVEQCGSGHPVDLGTPHTLEVELSPAAAHNQRGHSTLAQREAEPGLPVVRVARLICDFEGHVDWALGVGQRVPFRTFTLQQPARLVIDLRH